jgi:hypothetical protein
MHPTRWPAHIAGTCLLLAALVACGTGEPPWSDRRRNHPSSPENAGEIVFFLPTYLPQGVEAKSASILRGKKEAGSYSAVLGRRDGAAYADVITVSVHEAREDRSISKEERERHETVRIRGERARLDSLDELGVSLDWFRDGLAVAVRGDKGSRALVIETARALALPASGDATRVRFRSHPNELLGESTLPTAKLTSYRLDLSPTGGSPVAGGITVHLFLGGDVSPASFAVGLADRLRFGTVRDAGAALGYSRTSFTVEERSVDVEQASVAWLEHPDILVSVSGSFSEDDAVRVAEGLERVSEEEWRAALEVQDR